MRNVLLIATAFLGLALIATAFSMARDHAAENATAERAAPDDPGVFRRVAGSLRTGIFQPAPIDAAELLPPAPDGFVRRPYSTPDGEAIAGHALMTDRVVTTPKGPHDAVLSDLADAASARKLGAAALYEAPDRRLALRIQADLPAFREAAEGRLRPPLEIRPDHFARLDGIPALGIHGYADDGSLHDLQSDNRLIRLDFRGLVAIEIFADAAVTDADIAAILAGLDIAAVHGALPVRLPAYAPGTGLTTADGTPWAGAPVTPPLAFRARVALEDAPEKTDAERKALSAIASGDIDGWPELRTRFGDAATRSSILEALLGPAPDS